MYCEMAKFLQMFESFHGDLFLSVTPLNKAAQSLYCLKPIFLMTIYTRLYICIIAMVQLPYKLNTNFKIY